MRQLITVILNFSFLQFLKSKIPRGALAPSHFKLKLVPCMLVILNPEIKHLVFYYPLRFSGCDDL